MGVSVLRPIDPAIDHAKRVCFQPFDLGKWFCLGFCAWLSFLGEGGGGGGGNYYQDPGQFGGGDFSEWLDENLPIIIGVVAAVVAVSFIFGIVLTWLQSRGRFMFIDGVVHNRANVVQPWREFAALGNNLFLFRFVVGLGFFLGFCAIVALGIGVAWSDIEAKRFGSSAQTALALSGTLGALTLVFHMIVRLLLLDLVVPTMYLRRERVMDAWATVRNEILVGNLGRVFLYFLMRFLIGIVVAILALLAGCLTCCIGFLPYLWCVVQLPLLVFTTSYKLYFLEEFGPNWQFFGVTPEDVFE